MEEVLQKELAGKKHGTNPTIVFIEHTRATSQPSFEDSSATSNRDAFFPRRAKLRSTTAPDRPRSVTPRSRGTWSRTRVFTRLWSRSNARIRDLWHRLNEKRDHRRWIFMVLYVRGPTWSSRLFTRSIVASCSEVAQAPFRREPFQKFRRRHRDSPASSYELDTQPLLTSHSAFFQNGVPRLISEPPCSRDAWFVERNGRPGPRVSTLFLEIGIEVALRVCVDVVRENNGFLAGTKVIGTHRNFLKQSATHDG